MFAFYDMWGQERSMSMGSIEVWILGVWIRYISFVFFFSLRSYCGFLMGCLTLQFHPPRKSSSWQWSIYFESNLFVDFRGKKSRFRSVDKTLIKHDKEIYIYITWITLEMHSFDLLNGSCWAVKSSVKTCNATRWMQCFVHMMWEGAKGCDA